MLQVDGHQTPMQEIFRLAVPHALVRAVSRFFARQALLFRNNP